MEKQKKLAPSKADIKKEDDRNRLQQHFLAQLHDEDNWLHVRLYVCKFQDWWRKREQSFIVDWPLRIEWLMRNAEWLKDEFLKELLEYADTVPEALRAAGCRSQSELFQILKYLNTQRGRAMVAMVAIMM